MSAALFRLDPRGAPMIDGDTKLIAHVGYPTASFTAPSIYNPWFRRRGINAAIVPLGVRSENFREAFPQICRFSNFHGALITMPHKAAVVDWLDEASAAVRVAGACNAVRRNEDGKLAGDMFDGEGFVRAAAGAGRNIAGQRVLIIGAGGVGSAIAAACAKAGAAEIALFDTRAGAAERLAERLRRNYPASSFRSARMSRQASTSRSMPRRSGPIGTTRCPWILPASRRRFSSARWCSSLGRRHFSRPPRRGG
jgi:shikimate dehydrogenase